MKNILLLLREKRGLSRWDVAVAIGVTQNTSNPSNKLNVRKEPSRSAQIVGSLNFAQLKSAILTMQK